MTISVAYLALNLPIAELYRKVKAIFYLMYTNVFNFSTLRKYFSSAIVYAYLNKFTVQ